jgi:hypothetical protein
MAGQELSMSSSRHRTDVSPEAHRAKRALFDQLSSGESDLEVLADLMRDLQSELQAATRKQQEDAVVTRSKSTA